MEQKLEYKKLTTEKHGGSRNKITPTKFLKKYKFSVLFRDYPWWKTYYLKLYTLYPFRKPNACPLIPAP